MSNKFNQYTSEGDANVTDGSLDIYGYTLRAENLDANEPMKTNSIGQLISSKLNIADVVNLQAELDSSIQNPNQSNLVSDGVEVTTGNVLKTDTLTSTTTPVVGTKTVSVDADLSLTTGKNLISDNVVCNTLSSNSGTGEIALGSVDLNASGQEINGVGILRVNTINTVSTGNIAFSDNVNMNNNDITAVNSLDANSITSTISLNSDVINNAGAPQITVNSDLDLGSNAVKTNTAEINLLYGTNQTNDINIQNNINMSDATNKNISNVGTLTTTEVDTVSLTNTAGTNVLVRRDLEMKSNDILGVNNMNVNTIDGHGVSGDITMNGNNIVLAGNVQTATLTTSGGSAITCNNNLDMNSNNITNVATINTGILNCSVIQPPGSTIINTSGANFINASAYRGILLDINTINDLSSNGISVTSEFKMNQNDITDIRSMSLTATQYISRIEDMGTPVGNYYIIPDNTTWIIIGQITLTYGIEFGINCSLRGIDFSAQITFDETSRDCDIKAVDNNFYLSQLTIVDGGGRFTGNTTLVRGLLNAQNYNVSAPAPFYARNKRFKVTDVNILRPFKIGTIEGFGTLNITNNFFNGGGGLAGQASSYYTNEGISISDGLSLEFNNNKVVLMLGAQQASTLKQLNMKARVSSLLGFNAVTITGNIFHPRNSETGIDFDADSRTELGNISGNVFIRTGGSAPLINYTDQPTYDNYNPLSIENYSINANTGVVDSEPNLKCGVNESQSISSSTATLLEPVNNADVEIINVSARFAIQLDLTGVSVAFVANERITDTASGSTALILAVDGLAGGNQSVYITDMSGKFSASPTTFTSAIGSATGGSLRWIFRYSEKDPRKLTLSATFSVSVGSNKEYFIAPSMNGMADPLCEVGGVSTNTGAGATLSVVCSKKYEEGDKEQFYFRTTDASAGSVTKGIIIIK
jgi:hypothetical protein